MGIRFIDHTIPAIFRLIYSTHKNNIQHTHTLAHVWKGNTNNQDEKQRNWEQIQFKLDFIQLLIGIKTVDQFKSLSAASYTAHIKPYMWNM